MDDRPPNLFPLVFMLPVRPVGDINALCRGPSQALFWFESMGSLKKALRCCSSELALDSMAVNGRDENPDFPLVPAR